MVSSDAASFPSFSSPLSFLSSLYTSAHLSYVPVIPISFPIPFIHPIMSA